MQECHSIGRTSPKLEANFLSRLFFFWMKKFYYEMRTEGLQLKNLYQIQESNESSKLVNRVEEIWNMEIKRTKLKKKGPSLLLVILKAFSFRYLCWGLLGLINATMIKPVQPLILSSLIKLFSNDRYIAIEVLFHGAVLCLLTIAGAILNHHFVCSTNLIGMRIRVAVSSLIYRKVLKLSQSSLRSTTAGQVINLLSNDVARFDLVAFGINVLWIAPIQLLIVGYFMWTKIGSASLAGLVTVLVMSIPFQLTMGRATAIFRKQVAERSDKRIKIMNEILTSVQTIKMYTWETPFEHFLQKARDDEMKYITRTSYIRGLFSSCLLFTDRITLAVTILCFAMQGNELTPDLVFSLSMYFNILQVTFAHMFPKVIAMGAETLVSIKRLQDFLLLEERDTSKVSISKTKDITVKNVDALWLPNAPILKRLNIELTAGSLCAVIGPVGSGKSSFLNLLLGELSASSGMVEHSCNISYSSQEPWLFSSTLRKNILFGNDFDADRYRKVVEVCSLERDFKNSPEGDKTRADDKGVSLSGGQKARINLARAVYKDSDIYLFDDPFSAVDPAVGRHLFDKCVLEFLKDKTRIIVTHQSQFLKQADNIIVLNKGSIEAYGSFEEILSGSSDITSLLDATNETAQNECAREQSLISKTAEQPLPLPTNNTDEVLPRKSIDNDIFHDKCDYEGSAFWAYVRSSGNSPAVATFLLFILSQVLLSGTDYWITFWTVQEDTRRRSINFNTTLKETFSQAIYRNSTGITMNQKLNVTRTVSSFFQDIKNKITDLVIEDGQEHVLLKKEFLMFIYAFLIVAAVVVTLTRSTVFFYSCMQASKKLHNNMFRCLLQAPMRFFYTNSSGTILNRFSKDIGSVDEMMPRTLMEVLQISLIMSGIFLMVIVANPYLIFLVVIFSIFFIKVRKWYISTIKAIKHIEAVAKSPVFSYVRSSFEGITTIRAAKNEDILKKQFDEYQDVHSSAWYLIVLCSASFGLWLDMICVIFIWLVIIGFVMLDQFISVPGSFVGLAISQSYNLLGMLQFGVRQLGDVVNYLTGIERILDYTQLEKEQSVATFKDSEVEEHWPREGKIVFQNLNLKYAFSEPPILKNLNIRILPAEKIGIVGRTGAGKSSLIAALFRLAFIEGKILIDDVNIETLDLKKLRRKISIIPQDPILFSSTVRYNLDPLNEFNEDQLWNALEEVELKNAISSLDFTVAEGGNNFSVGQKQLICLARVILKNNKILILDEATANIDPTTDDFIQNTIRRKFRECTVLTVAHRLNTIIDSDKVLVMKDGCSVEFDHPHILLQNKGGFFTKMLQEMGPNMEQTLTRIASESFKSKTSVTRL